MFSLPKPLKNNSFRVIYRFYASSTNNTPVPVPNNKSKSPELVKPVSSVMKRPPTVAEEIVYTKKYDVKSKVLYDAFRNEQQKALYNGDDEEGPVKSLWKQVGDDSWFEARRAKLLRNRFGKDFSLSGAPSVLKKKQIRYWNTLDFVENVQFFMLRFRYRIWEDIGTVHIVVPVKGSKRQGELHVKAYTRDTEWVLLKSWIEDEEMIIEVKRRIDLDYLMNSNNDTLHDIQKEDHRINTR